MAGRASADPAIRAVVRAVDDEMCARDRIVAFDVTILGRHPDIHPGASRSFAVAPLPFYLWPLGLLDSTMGGIMAGFGPPGRWLGQGSGKILIGWAGMLMMAAAAVWGVMDYLGWSW